MADSLPYADMHTYICKAAAFFMMSVLLFSTPLSVFAEDTDGALLATPSEATTVSTSTPPIIQESVGSIGSGTTTPNEKSVSVIESAPHTLIPDGTSIGTDITWTKAGSPYVIEGSITIQGGSLSIAPGVVVKLGRSGSININGGTFTVGNDHSHESVIFTSIADDTTGGDTNSDSTATLPDNNRWFAIEVGSESAVVDIGHAEFRYSGAEATHALCAHLPPLARTCNDAKRFNGTIHIDAGTVSIHDSHFEWTGGSHIFAVDGSITFARDRFDSAGGLINVWPNPQTPSLTVTLHDSSIGDAPIRLTHKKAVFDFQNNWWGNPNGPQGEWYWQGWDPYEDVTPTFNIEPWLVSDPFAGSTTPENVQRTGSCASNVLFLPGIEDSRLYDTSGKLWEPSFLNADADIAALSLDEQGKSVRSGVFTKDGDLIDSFQGTDIYSSFTTQMNALEDAGTMEDWKAFSYDWRLSLENIIGSGKKTETGISYLSATDTPYLEQTLRALAASSKTGKVTIVAHSNGGLVAKALLERLGAQTTAMLVDNIVLVGAPQSGAPETIGALLYGYRSGIPKNFPFIVSPDVIRTFLRNAPMIYHLLPSQTYFDTVTDPDHPVATFSGTHAYQNEMPAYGNALNDAQELGDFLLANDGGREAPPAWDLSRAAVANPDLVSYARIEHILLDTWSPPPGVNVFQIGGWGIDTISGIKFYEQKDPLGIFGYKKLYRPDFVIDGDDTVPIPSALMMPADTYTKSYWLDLAALTHDTGKHYDHGTLLAAPPVLEFVNKILLGEAPIAPLLSRSSPAFGDGEKRLRFFIHSPDVFDLYDESSAHTGVSSTGSIEELIPGSVYGVFGEVQYISAPAGVPYHLTIRSRTTHAFSLDVEEVTGDTVVATSTLANVPIDAAGTAALSIKDSIGDASPLTVDRTGDGVQDLSLIFTEGSTTAYEAPSVSDAAATNSEIGEHETESSTGQSIHTPRNMVAFLDGSLKREPISNTASTVEQTVPSEQALVDIHLEEAVEHPADPTTSSLHAFVPSEISPMLAAAVLDAASGERWLVLQLQRLLSWLVLFVKHLIGHV